MIVKAKPGIRTLAILAFALVLIAPRDAEAHGNVTHTMIHFSEGVLDLNLTVFTLDYLNLFPIVENPELLFSTADAVIRDEKIEEFRPAIIMTVVENYTVYSRAEKLVPFDVIFESLPLEIAPGEFANNMWISVTQKFALPPGESKFSLSYTLLKEIPTSHQTSARIFFEEEDPDLHLFNRGGVYTVDFAARSVETLSGGEDGEAIDDLLFSAKYEEEQETPGKKIMSVSGEITPVAQLFAVPKEENEEDAGSSEMTSRAEKAGDDYRDRTALYFLLFLALGAAVTFRSMRSPLETLVLLIVIASGSSFASDGLIAANVGIHLGVLFFVVAGLSMALPASRDSEEKPSKFRAGKVVSSAAAGTFVVAVATAAGRSYEAVSENLIAIIFAGALLGFCVAAFQIAQGAKGYDTRWIDKVVTFSSAILGAIVIATF
ncbi:MAG: hypothetical protein NUW37_17150 [Planctomycetes bacterium]|nr:hypothetical protein [Planctomycetota bacterium]